MNSNSKTLRDITVKWLYKVANAHGADSYIKNNDWKKFQSVYEFLHIMRGIDTIYLYGEALHKPKRYGILQVLGISGEASIQSLEGELSQAAGEGRITITDYNSVWAIIKIETILVFNGSHSARFQLSGNRKKSQITKYDVELSLMVDEEFKRQLKQGTFKTY
ncbi:hypothetical protein J4204_03300 [Candidatus Woesearchaeota archaeon]|nr:hypothetical protein [Candidatus Woesearchaeota archaeon]